MSGSNGPNDGRSGSGSADRGSASANAADQGPQGGQGNQQQPDQQQADQTRDPPASGGSTLTKWVRRIVAGIVVFVGLIALLFALGVIGIPSAGVEDPGDWGAVGENRTEIVSSVWVNNPNPVGISLGDAVRAEYDVRMNGVLLAQGSKSNFEVPPDNSTREVRTYLLNERLNEWWVEFIDDDETIGLAVDSTVHIDAGVSDSRDFPVRQTLLENSTPMIDSLSSAANQTRGDYSRPVSAGQFDDSALGDVTGDASVRVGYQIERGWATWQSVDANETHARFHLDVHNPGDVPLPADPDGIGVDIEMNGVDMFEAQNDEVSVAGAADENPVIPAGETREVTFDVVMDNELVDDWFTSHVRQGERTNVSAQMNIVFTEPASGEEFRIPGESVAPYECTFATEMLVDNQTGDSTCGESPAPAGN